MHSVQGKAEYWLHPEKLFARFQHLEKKMIMTMRDPADEGDSWTPWVKSITGVGLRSVGFGSISQ